jgi:hypothetical protein
MAKPNKQRTEKSRQDRQESGQVAAGSRAPSVSEAFAAHPVNRFFQSSFVRFLCSFLLVGYLAVVWLGPLSNPVGSEFLTRPLARWVAPIHRSLFLGHGYRFFGPDPGPSHLLVYRIVNAEGDLVEYRFPDRDTIWPRLLYHRWFMLSETLYQELNFTIDQQSFEETQAELSRQIEALQFNRRHRLARRIQRERQRIETDYRNARTRIEKLLAAIGATLMERHQGTSIEMYLQERTIPFPAAVLTGTKLNDPVFLSDLRKIAEFRRDSAGVIRSVDDLWQEQAQPPSGDGLSNPGEAESRPGSLPELSPIGNLKNQQFRESSGDRGGRTAVAVFGAGEG